MGSPETYPNAFAQDHDLLREYAEGGAERAFRALVERHGGMVYGVARRLVGDEHAAADITQSVFLALARKSSALPRSVPLAGWLHTAARYAASHWRRSEARRSERERAASAEQLHVVNAESERMWDEISPSLDAALRCG
jgi:RNA polymerase sigma factor (sigma-70 family)